LRRQEELQVSPFAYKITSALIVRRFTAVTSSLIPILLDTLEFIFSLVSRVEGNQSVKGARLAGLRVREFRVCMQAGNGRVGPGAVDGFPRGDYPVIAAF
jgi:hypothetical protein